MIKKDEGIHLNWPYYNPNTKTVKKANADNSYATAIKSIEDYFQQCVAYSRGSNRGEIDIRLEAMKGIFDGDKQLYIHANFIKEISSFYSIYVSIGIFMNISYKTKYILIITFKK